MSTWLTSTTMNTVIDALRFYERMGRDIPYDEGSVARDALRDVDADQVKYAKEVGE